MLKETKKRNIDIKKETVDAMSDKIGDSSAVVFTDYKGMTMPQLNELRDKLFTNKAEYNVTKNTLMVRALKAKGNDVNNEQFTGPTATLFASGDAVEAVKILFDFVKKNQMPAVKFGVFDGSIVDDKQLESISKLPGKPELIGQVVGTIGSPLYGLVGTLNGTLVNLVMTLEALKVKKGGE